MPGQLQIWVQDGTGPKLRESKPNKRSKRSAGASTERPSCRLRLPQHAGILQEDLFNRMGYSNGCNRIITSGWITIWLLDFFGAENKQEDRPTFNSKHSAAWKSRLAPASFSRRSGPESCERLPLGTWSMVGLPGCSPVLAQMVSDRHNCGSWLARIQESFPFLHAYKSWLAMLINCDSPTTPGHIPLWPVTSNHDQPPLTIIISGWPSLRSSYPLSVWTFLGALSSSGCCFHYILVFMNHNQSLLTTSRSHYEPSLIFFW